MVIFFVGLGKFCTSMPSNVSDFHSLTERNIEKRLLIVGVVESFYLGLRLPRDIVFFFKFVLRRNHLRSSV